MSTIFDNARNLVKNFQKSAQAHENTPMSTTHDHSVRDLAHLQEHYNDLIKSGVPAKAAWEEANQVHGSPPKHNMGLTPKNEERVKRFREDPKYGLNKTEEGMKTVAPTASFDSTDKVYEHTSPSSEEVYAYTLQHPNHSLDQAGLSLSAADSAFQMSKKKAGFDTKAFYKHLADAKYKTPGLYAHVTHLAAHYMDLSPEDRALAIYGHLGARFGNKLLDTPLAPDYAEFLTGKGLNEFNLPPHDADPGRIGPHPLNNLGNDIQIDAAPGQITPEQQKAIDFRALPEADKNKYYKDMPPLDKFKQTVGDTLTRGFMKTVYPLQGMKVGGYDIDLNRAEDRRGEINKLISAMLKV